MFRVEGIDHGALTVRDVARSVAWYRDVLSLRHIAFRVDRATFGRAQLEARGITPTFEDHSAAHSLYFPDPDGHQLEITTYDLAR